MQPGLGRAIPMGIFGFLLGLFLIVVLRAVQGLEPAWSAGPALVVAAFTAAGFFVWGMGAFDPRMSEHGEAHTEHGAEATEDADEAESAEEDRSPLWLLSNYVWISGFGLLIILLITAILAFGPLDLSLHTTDTAESSVLDSGLTTITIAGNSYELSQGALFIAFVVFTLFSLAVAGGVIGFAVFYLARSLKEVEGQAPVEARTPPLPVQFALGRVMGYVIRFFRWLPQFLFQR